MAPSVITTTTVAPAEDDEYVFFHGGGTASYRKVEKKLNSEQESAIIPTIDISAIDGMIEERKKIAEQIYDASSTSGFFYLTNHGVPDELLAETFDLMKRFFALDREIKMEAHVQKNPAIRGYEPLYETRLDPRTKGDTKEAFTMGDCPLEPEQGYIGKTGHPPPANIKRPQNIWPSSAPWWRDGIYKYYNAVLPLALKLVKIMALAFDLDEFYFDQYFKFPITGMRPLHYPPLPPDRSGDIGLGAHTDFDWFTMVLQDDVPALEILTKEGHWVTAQPKPKSFVCNIGQLFERMTNGKFVATVHRVRNMTGQERYSLPFFLTMDPDASIKVIDGCLEPGETPKFKEENVGVLYVQRVLPARIKHPKAIKYVNTPPETWTYDIMYADI